MTSSDSIEASAATIDEAIGQALTRLGAEQDDVTIEVLSTPRSGVLGIGARLARVRVTRRAPAEARSGVMSPPPAPPLRPTPPEMRRPEARPQPRREPEQAPPPRETGAEVVDRERRESAVDERREAPADESREAQPVARRDTPRQPAPSRGAERSEASGDAPRGATRDLQRAAPGEVQGRDDRSDLPRRERGEATPRQRSRGPARTSAEESAPREHSAPTGDARRESAHEERAGVKDREGDESAPENLETRDDLGHQGENGRPRPRSRRGRGRGRGRAGGPSTSSAGGSADRGERGGGRPAEAAPQRAEASDRAQEHDQESDPFASVDEPGNDPRQIADLQEQAREATIFLRRLLELMGEQATIEPAETDDPETLELNIKGDGSGILIGRHGQTLDAIEYMVNRLLARKIKDAAPISVDTESYRARRRRLLQRMALSKGEQAKREHVTVTVDPMPPRDRRIVHLALKDDPMIATRSTGEGFMRAIEIVPVVERHDPNEPGNENRGRGRTREVDRDKAPIGEQGGFKHGQKRIV